MKTLKNFGMIFGIMKDLILTHIKAMNITKLTAMACMLLILGGCHPKTSNVSNEQKGTNKENNTGYEKLTVKDLTGLDGCTFVLIKQDGKKLEPMNLPDEFRKDGIKVLVKYTVKRDAISICMVGSMVEVSDIKMDK